MSVALIDRLSDRSAEIVDYDTRGGLTVRRNLLIGLWAAGRLGLPAAEAEAYAWRIHLADMKLPGEDDLIARIAADLAQAGDEVPVRTIRRQLREMEARAALDLEAEPS